MLGCFLSLNFYHALLQCNKLQDQPLKATLLQCGSNCITLCAALTRVNADRSTAKVEQGNMVPLVYLYS